MALDFQTVGGRIRACRLEAGMSQERLAELSDLSPPYVSHVERGAKGPRLCSHKGIDNKGKIDKGKNDNIKHIIASENTTKSFETAKKPLNLIALSVQLLIIVPRIFTVAFRRDYGYVTKFRRQRLRIVSFVCPVHQKIDWLVNRTKTSQQGAAFRSIAAVSRRQCKHYPIPSGCTLIQVESRLTTFT